MVELLFTYQRTPLVIQDTWCLVAWKALKTHKGLLMLHHKVQQYCILGIMKNWALLSKNVALKPASIFVRNSLAVSNLKMPSEWSQNAFNKFLWNFKSFYFTEYYASSLTLWCLHQSITQQRIGLWVDFFTVWCHFVLRHAFSSTAVHTVHAPWTYLCPP